MARIDLLGIVAQAEAMEDTEETLFCAEVFLLRKVASAASDVLKARHWEEFREHFPLSQMEDALDNATAALEKWRGTAQSD